MRKTGQIGPNKENQDMKPNEIRVFTAISEIKRP